MLGWVLPNFIPLGSVLCLPHACSLCLYPPSSPPLPLVCLALNLGSSSPQHLSRHTNSKPCSPLRVAAGCPLCTFAKCLRPHLRCQSRRQKHQTRTGHAGTAGDTGLSSIAVIPVSPVPCERRCTNIALGTQVQQAVQGCGAWLLEDRRLPLLEASNADSPEHDSAPAQLRQVASSAKGGQYADLADLQQAVQAELGAAHEEAVQLLRHRGPSFRYGGWI